MAFELLIFSGNSNPNLAAQVAYHAGQDLGSMFVGSFADGETRVEIGQNVRGADVFLIQSTSSPANHHLMELLIMADACRRASARKITLVIPYFGYARQERKNTPRSPITGKLAADLIEAAGVDRVLTFELHNLAVQGFFSIPVDHLFFKPILCQHLKDHPDPFVVVSPDAGGAERARQIAKPFHWELAIMDKRRSRPNESQILHVLGDVAQKNCLIVDDIVDTGGSLLKAAQALKEAGATRVWAAAAHGVFSLQALENIQTSPYLEGLLVTDSIDLPKDMAKIRTLPLAPLLGEAILRLHGEGSISSLCI
jgi:ribose-phosphate pyrophosphokinase